ncbi:M1 family metallopeptidase [Novosphingobium sp.]|uniref:M1 family metallopeptidase n=1 Tax=Novosphingobium sp. TaxID=1874826 RepID=UPI0025FCB113|nr:M1 family metallopeptidase [Novosphingobium sp.]
MRNAIAALALAVSIIPFATLAQDADDTDWDPPLAERTRESGLPLTANQTATGLDALDLSLRIDPAATTLTGIARYRLTALAPISRLEFDLDPRYAISAMRLNGGLVTSERWRNDKGLLSVDLPQPASKGAEIALEVRYSGHPHKAKKAPWDGGIQWSRTPSGQPWIATAVQGEGCDLIYPCIDNSQKRVAVIDAAIAVPAPLVAAGNGKFMGRSDEGGWTTWKWQTRNLNTYALALNIGPYQTVERTYASRFGNSYPISFWYLPGNRDKAVALVDQMTQFLDFFERAIGPYPAGAEKVGLVETPHLGMEHQTINAYGNGFKLAPEGYDWLMHHEFSHEWFANQLAETEPKHMWLQEGLGSYMQPLYLQQKLGEANYHAALWDMRKKIVAKVALVPDGRVSSAYYNDKDAGWGGDIYYKGAWIAHTLRALIGDKAFFATLRRVTYGRDDPRPGNFLPVYRTSDDFRSEAEKASGKDLTWFFEAYLSQGPLPKLTVTRTGQRLDLAWTTAGHTVFPMPLDVRVGSRVARLPMTGGRGSVTLGGDTSDYTIDPESKILRDNQAITEWQAQEKAEKDAKAKAAAAQ